MPSMQYDVKSVRITDDGQALNYRVRVKGIYGLGGTGVGSVKLYNGTSASGTPLIWLDTAASTSGPFISVIPGEGVLFDNGVYVDVTDVTGVTIYYG